MVGLRDYSSQDLLKEINSRMTPFEQQEMYEDFIVGLASLVTGKECLFKQDDDDWYNRHIQTYMTLEEVLEFLYEYVQHYTE